MGHKIMTDRIQSVRAPFSARVKVTCILGVHERHPCRPGERESRLLEVLRDVGSGDLVLALPGGS